MSDQTVIAPPLPEKPPRRKPGRKPKLTAPDKPKEFEGLTAGACAASCRKGHCVISGRSYCAHPYKGGLQSIDMSNRAAVERIARAKAHLGHQAVDKR